MRIFYILIFVAGLGFSSHAQIKPVAQKEQQTVKYYPNPAVNLINFELAEKPRVPQTISIFNFLGKKVIEQILENQKTTINIDELYRGVYIFQIRNTQGVIVESGKFQVVK